MPDELNPMPPPDPVIARAVEVLVGYLTEYLHEFPPVRPGTGEATKMSQEDLRAYYYEGAIYVLVNAFAYWTLTKHGFSEQTSLFGQAILFIGGRDGEVPTSAPGKTTHVWKLPVTGLYAFTEANLRPRLLH